MGKKGGWFSAVRKALIPTYSKEKKEKKVSKSASKKSWFGKQKSLDTDISQPEAALANPACQSPPKEEEKLAKAENEQSKHAYSVAYATAKAAEAAVAAAHAAAEVVRLTSASRFLGKSKEEIAAIKIQTAFRAYLARRALRALKGLGRLKSLIQGQSVKRQATSTLRCMQTLARVQSQVRARRIRMSEENQALQRQILQKREKELDSIRASLGSSWNDSSKSKEELEAILQSKQEAATRRERALAYAHSHQQMWRNSSKSPNPTFMDPTNPHWGWSWLERWMAARPWENPGTTELNSDRNSVKSMTRSASLGDMSKRFSLPPSRQSPSTPTSKAPSVVGGKYRPASPKGSVDEDSRSLYSVQSERHRRHSIANSSVRDDESLASSPSGPSYMSSTKSTKARSRMASPSPTPSPLGSGKKGTPEKASSSTGSAKKRLSFSCSPSGVARSTAGGGARRLSGPPRMDSNSVKDVRVKS